MKDLGPTRRILGMDIVRDREKEVLYLSQSEYLKKVIRSFRMEYSKSSQTLIGAHFKLSKVKEHDECVDTHVTPYSSAVGSIMYGMVGSRPDLAYGIGIVSRFMSNSGHVHWEAVKCLLIYIKGTTDLRLMFTRSGNLKVQGYCDSDFAADLDRRRSISGYIFTVGGNVLSWKSSFQ